MKSFISLLLICSFTLAARAQHISVFRLMEQRDKTLAEITELANQRFSHTGTGMGSGYKQFHRWLNEMQYHVDENGNFLPPGYDWQAYLQAKEKLKAPSSFARYIGNRWTERGPLGSQYTGSLVLGHGRVTDIAIHPTNSNIIYVATGGGGIWKTTNGGTSWQPLTDNNGTMAYIFSIAIAPSNPSLLYAGTRESGIIKSTDAGQTWTNTGVIATSVTKIIINPNDPNNVIGCSYYNGILRSTDGGTTWKTVLTHGITDLAFKPDNTTIVYASGYGDSTAGVSAMWRSVNNGASWMPVSTTQIHIKGRTRIGVTQANPNVVYLAQADADENFYRLYKSTNQGVNFMTAIIGNPGAGTNFFGYNIDGTGAAGIANHAMSIAVNPANEQEVYLGSVNIWRSVNGGGSFTLKTYWVHPGGANVGYAYHHADVHQIIFRGNTLYTGSDGGIYKSADNSSSWTDINGSMGIRMLYQVATAHSNANMYVASSQDNGTSYHRSDSSWKDWAGGDGVNAAVSVTDPNLSLAFMQFGFMSRTTNAGQTSTGLQRPAVGAFLIPVSHHKQSNTVYAGFDGGVYKTTDFGLSWTKVSGNNISGTVNKLAVAQSDSKYIYAAVGSTLYVTRNGSTWTSRSVGNNISSIAVSPLNPDRVWISTSSNTGSLFFSSDAGTTITQIGAGLPDMAVRCLAVDDNYDESVYVGMNTGVYYIDKYSTGWTNLTDNLPATAVADIEIHSGADIVRVAMLGRGVWDMPVYIPPCPAPDGLTASNITFNSAQITWNPVNAAYGYEVQYQAQGASSFLQVLTGNTTVSLTNLVADKEYTVKVRTICEADTGLFVTGTFTTLPNPCKAPGTLTANPVGTASATLNWVAAQNATSYNIRHRRINDIVWVNDATGFTGTTFQLTGLTFNTFYVAEVKSNCYVGTPAISSVAFRTALPGGKISVTGKQVLTEPVMNNTDILLWPNPAHNQLHLQAGSLPPGTAMQITDVQGRVLIKKLSMGQLMSIDVSVLSAGVYFIRFNNKEGIKETLRFVKN